MGKVKAMSLLKADAVHPMLLTIKLDERSQAFFERARQSNFPRYANHVPAHCTLLHKLPSNEIFIQEILGETRLQPCFNMQVTGLENFTHGVAYTMYSEDLQLLHSFLQKKFDPWLIGRDRLPIKPHITIQDSVTAYKAACLYKKLNEEFTNFTVQATAISSWLCLKRTWKHVMDFEFFNK
jgi:hypothetical protein